MTNRLKKLPLPRLAPDRALPPYAYVPGRHPHPIRDPRGHSYGGKPDQPRPPDPRRWWACPMYVYGIDLFNHGYYWEAHEAWEGLWNACGRRGPTGSFLKALIALAAAGLKACGGNPRGVAAHARRAVELFGQAGSRPGSAESRYMGLDPRALQTWAGEVAARPPVGGEDSRGAGSVVFEFVLRPER